jgi:hypothetical protein
MLSMIVLRFPDEASERKALGFLAGRFSFRTWATGETLVPEVALPFLALEGIPFIAQGPPRYEQNLPAFRTPPASASE